jgi:hypothetical protein
MQVFRDMGRAAAFYPPDEFLSDLLSGAPQDEIAEVGRRALEFATRPPFQNLDQDARRRATAWEQFVVDVFRLYQETALQEVGPKAIISSKYMQKPEFWH